MPRKERPLPKPRKTPFGKNRAFAEESPDEPLLADEIAMAASQGKLDDYIKERLPDSEHARRLVEMMMGMTGMMSPAAASPEKNAAGKESKDPGGADEGDVSPGEVPEDVAEAVKSSDVQGLIELLRREHIRRSGGKADEEADEGPKPVDEQPTPKLEKQVIEELVKISRENGLTLDWLFFRALKRYVEEYRKTGAL